jgi:5'-nucleotidase
MRILLTNDDGVTAPGLRAAAAALAQFGNVTVVAPVTNYSGYGAAFPPARSLTYYPYEPAKGEQRGAAVYGLATTPAACAYVGMSGVLGGPFDLVVSGINHGANMGRDVFYSGTVGAALTAHLLGAPAIAVSLEARAAGILHWDAAGWALTEAVRLWQANDASRDAFFNVNAPNLPRSQLAGALVTTLSNRSFLTRYRLSRDPHAEHGLTFSQADDEDVALVPWTDEWAVALRYASITPLRAVPDMLSAAQWNASGAEMQVASAPQESPAIPLAPFTNELLQPWIASFS